MESFRHNIAVSLQEPYLFKGSIEDNLWTETSNQAMTDKVMKETGIQYLEGKMIEDQSEEISGGERQRISIARALLKNTELLLLDEPSNHLDRNSKKWLKEFIMGCDKTIIVITHDKELLSSVEDIIYI